ncbi:MAG TPA: hypothetical protein VGC50_03140 [Gammaproteobacteria bacterium]|jgi:hypothetical protein
MIRNALLFCLASTVPLCALAQSGPTYRCVNGDLVRRVEILYETGVAVPCEVHYFKDTEAPGQREVLWVARNQSGYCEARTQEFIAELGGLGWQCVDTANEPEAPVSGTQAPAPDDAQRAIADDTETLSAGDDPEPVEP